MTDVIADFCEHHHSYNGISLRRRHDQEKVLRQFEEALGGGTLIEADHGDVAAFLREALDRPLHPNTVRKYRNMLMPFFTWAWRERLIDGDRLLRIRDVRAPRESTSRSDPKPYTRIELDRFYRELNVRWPYASETTISRWKQGNAGYGRVWKHGMRLQIDAIVTLALCEAMRQQEIYVASIEDVHPLNRYAIIREGTRKGDGRPKFREVPMQDRARAAMQAWLDWRTLLQPEHDFTWLCLHPRWALRPMNSTRFGMLLLTVGDWQLHRLRHTCATEWLRAGMPLKYVSEYLGHSSIRQTECYTKVVRDDLEAASVRAAARFNRATAPREEAEAA
jgi:site-specific recombinase XerD